MLDDQEFVASSYLDSCHPRTRRRKSRREATPMPKKSLRASSCCSILSSPQDASSAEIATRTQLNRNLPNNALKINQPKHAKKKEEGSKGTKGRAKRPPSRPPGLRRRRRPPAAGPADGRRACGAAGGRRPPGLQTAAGPAAPAYPGPGSSIKADVSGAPTDFQLYHLL
jgi:hypothetical protein